MLTNEDKFPNKFHLGDHSDVSNDDTMKDTLDDCNHDRKELETNVEDKEIRQKATNLSSLSSQFANSMQSAEISTVMLANSNKSLLELSRPHQDSPPSNDAKIEVPMSFSNLNVANTNDKIWSLMNQVPGDELSSQTYVDPVNASFSEQAVLHKVQNHSLMKQTMPGTNYNSSPSFSQSQLVTSSNSSLYNSSSNSLINKTYTNMNWPGVSQGQTSLPSSLTWSNNFNVTLSSVTSGVNTFSNTPNTNSLQNSWSNGLYNNVNNPKRPPIGNQNITNTIMTSKKSMYSMDANQSMLEANHKMHRNAAISSFKTISNSSNVYELGSTGSDNTSSSSDSANLRQNGLLQLQERNDSIGGPLDSMRYSLEPHLLDIMRNNANQEKAINFNFPYQNASQDDKKVKGRNFGRRRGKSPFFTGNDSEAIFTDFPTSSNENNERFSRKVFVGGLPPDIDEEEITASFRRYGPLVVDWPHKAESKSYFPPKGYAFLLFQDETSVQTLIDACIQEDDKLYLCVSSPTIKDKPVQIRPWRLSDADYVLDASMPLDPRKTVFVGGVPRPLKAIELAMIMDRLYGGVCYAGIDTDPELKYPKGAGRVAFSNQQSYIAAISARFVHLQHADIEKRVEVKPYVLDDQICDECQGARCGGKFAPYFCANITCLQYYCENCWATIHSRPGREFHKPLVKEGADRPRAVPFRWC